MNGIKSGKSRIVMGSRGSALALAQTGHIRTEIQNMNPGMEVSIKIIKTSADKDVVSSLRASSGAGVFVKELEHALLRGEIDLAVHSMKDVPTRIAEGLCIAAVPAREDARDALISSQADSLAALPAGARVGTGSFRRQAQILALRPDLEIADIRGNVDTRVQKMESGLYDAVILACAGLRRLGLEYRITCAFTYEQMLPAPGQGALAIETRADDVFVNGIAVKLNHANTAAAVAAERAFLERMGGGCNVPIAMYARVNQGKLEMDALVASPDGKKRVRDAAVCQPENSTAAINELAERMLSCGAAEILREFRN